MISFIVAMDEQNAIGLNNELPWHLPNDLKFFKEKTTGHTIVMGRKTFDSLGRVLPNRKHIVITRKGGGFPEEVEVVHDLDQLMKDLKQSPDEVFIIGGGHLFEQCLPYADRLYVTRIEDNFGGDIFFPEIVEDVWQMTSEVKGPKNERNPYDYYYIQYDRK
jgi:dihydrofolate reductase